MPPKKMDLDSVAPPAERPKAVLSWSSGKDSALALYRVLRHGQFDVVTLLTTVTEGVGRTSIHGVREELLELQAESIQMPLFKVYLPFPCPNAVYEERFGKALTHWKNQGATHVIFGDVFLEDVRRYREERLTKGKLIPVFPLWHENTQKLAQEVFDVGFKALLTCVDSKRLPPQCAGVPFDEKFIRSLPPHVDPCGENGEFHTFVYNGPLFQRPLAIRMDGKVSRQGFEFADLVAS